MEKKRRFGPRPKALKDLKLSPVMVRFSAEEFSQLDQLRGKTPRAVWCRDAALQRPSQPPAPEFPEVNRDVWGQLAQGPMSNMHQVVKLANQAELIEPGSGIKLLIERYQELIDIAHQIRAGLLEVIKR